MKCIPLNKPHTAAENYYIVNNRIIHFPFYDVWDGKYLMCDMSIQDFDGNIIQKQTPDVDYTGFDDRNRPNTGFAVAWAYKNHPNVYSFSRIPSMQLLMTPSAPDISYHWENTNARSN